MKIDSGSVDDLPLVGWQPNLLFAEYMFADKRQFPGFPELFTLPKRYHYTVEKWRAVQRYMVLEKSSDDVFCIQLPRDSEPPILIYGDDEMSLYLDEDSCDMRGEQDGEEHPENYA